MRDFPASDFQKLVGKTIIKVEDSIKADEGLTISFSDGTQLVTRFSGCEGEIQLNGLHKGNANSTEDQVQNV